MEHVSGKLMDTCGENGCKIENMMENRRNMKMMEPGAEASMQGLEVTRVAGWVFPAVGCVASAFK